MDDVIYIRRALEHFKNNYPNLKTELLYFGGARNAREFIKNVKNIGLSTNKKIIIMFDRDTEGVAGLKECIERKDINASDNNIYHKNSFFYLLYPKTSECHKSSEFVLEDYFSKKTKARYIKQKIKSNPLDIRNFNGLGDKIKKEIRNDINAINADEMSGFKILLNTIQSIVDNTAINVINI